MKPAHLQKQHKILQNDNIWLFQSFMTMRDQPNHNVSTKVGENHSTSDEWLSVLYSVSVFHQIEG